MTVAQSVLTVEQSVMILLVNQCWLCWSISNDSLCQSVPTLQSYSTDFTFDWQRRWFSAWKVVGIIFVLHLFFLIISEYNWETQFWNSVRIVYLLNGTVDPNIVSFSLINKTYSKHTLNTETQLSIFSTFIKKKTEDVQFPLNPFGYYLCYKLENTSRHSVNALNKSRGKKDDAVQRQLLYIHWHRYDFEWPVTVSAIRPSEMSPSTSVVMNL